MSKDTTLQIAAEHYESLRGYLASHIQKLMRESGQVKSRSASARDKLMKLNKSQFQELSTDVYDEMMRRTDEHAFPFLPVRDDFHPKRNQARQKLATLSTNRFRDLATDIYYEIERRFPSIVKSIQERMPLEPNSPKQYQYSDRNMDNRYPSQEKSPQEKYSRERSRERNERDRDRDRTRDYPPREREYSQRKDSSATPPDYQKSGTSPVANVSSLDNLMADIGSMLTSPRSQNSTINKEGSSNEINQLKKDHEDEINRMQKEIDELKTEVQDLKASLEEKTNALEVSEEKIKKIQNDYDAKEQECKDLLEEKEKLAKELDDLENEHQNLQEDYESREQMAKDIRQEVANLLDEVKVLQQKNEELLAEKEKNEETIRKLKEGQDIKEDNYSNPSSPRDQSPKDKSPKDDMVASAREELRKIFDDIRPELRGGIIKEDRIDIYEDAVNNLLDAKESEKPTNVLVAMKAIVISCKTITEDIGDFESTSDIRTDQREQLDTLKNYLSESLTALMTSAKSYATSQGKSSEPKLEDSLLSLTDSVIDLVKYASFLNNDDSSSRKDYMYRGSSNAKTVPELKDFIKDNTDKIVVSIQSLLYNLRESNSFDDEFLDIVNGITSIVDDIIKESHDTLDSLNSNDYKPDIENILLDLTNSNSKLDELGQKMISSPQSKSTKQQIAAASYDIANYVKNLISNLK